MSGICLFCQFAQSRPQPKNQLANRPMSVITDFLLGQPGNLHLKIFCHEKPDKHWEANVIDYQCDKFIKADYSQISKRIAFYKKSPYFNPTLEQISINL